MSANDRIPGYCIHTAKDQAYVRLGEQMIYLGTPGTPASKAAYERLTCGWMASGRTCIKPAERESISTHEVLLGNRRFAETYCVTARRADIGKRDDGMPPARPALPSASKLQPHRRGP